MCRRLVSFGFGVAEAAAPTAASTTNGAASNGSAPMRRQSDWTPLGQAFGLHHQQQQQQDEQLTPTDRVSDGAQSDVMSDLGIGTTIATTSRILRLSSELVTQAFDNQQDLHWITEPPNGSTMVANISGASGTSYPSELVAFAASQKQQQQQLQLQEQEQSFSDWWQEYWSRQPFPSGYTQSSITLVACLLTTFIFLIVVGNLLVCIAIFTEKSLKPIQNWFIASLAVSDMLLGLVVMPFSLARELMGFWVFGPLWCDIHEALDVLLTTASINTLCLISLDRYWSITQAVSYLKKRTPRRAVFMIAFVWVFSAAVSLPPLIGWKKQSPTVTGPINPNGTRSVQMQKPVQLLETNSNNNEDYSISQTEGAPRDQDLDQARDGAGSDQEQDETGLLVGESQHRPWLRNRRRTQTRNQQQQQPSKLNSIQNSARAQQPSIPSSSHLIPSLAALQQQQPVINFAYLSGEPQQQLEQQQTNEYPTCQLSDDIGYVLYSALGSFYIPCAVMVFTYIKIGLAARKRARRAINKQARHQQQAGGKRGAGSGGGNVGNPQRRTIAGMTSGRASKQLPVGDSALLLASSLADGSQPLDQINQRRTSAAAGHHRHRNSRAFIKTSEMPNTGGNLDSTSPSGEPPFVGKPVVVEKQKVISVIATTTSSSLQQKGEMQQVATALAMAKTSCEPEVQAASTCCTATLVTSGSKLASPSALKYSTSCGGISLAAQQQQQLEHCAEGKPLEEGLSQTSTSTSQQGQQRKPTSESNDSSLITVMSASMNELPQVTRFNFAPKQQQQVTEQQPVVQTEAQQTIAEALLRAISRAGRELTDDEILKGGEAALEGAVGESADGRADNKTMDNNSNNNKEQLPTANNSTNETCFMTIEEDSDNLESQTGRTIMMIASTAKQSSCSLANKSRVGMMMTMMPAATGAIPGGIQQPNDSPTIVCNNVACLRRQARRRANRHSSSYCGSSMTLNDDDEDEDEEDDGDEEEDEDDDEDALMANGGGGDSVDMMDDDDEHDGCIDEELLTDDCNGYSGGSCRLGAYCTGTVSSTCTHCRECAAMSTGTQPASSGECLQDSPLSCDAATYNYSKCTLQEDSPLMNTKNVISSTKCLNATSCRKRTNRRSKRHASQQAICHQHKLSPPSTGPRRHHGRPVDQQQHLACDVSEMEAQSLTGDDNLSLTDYYRSNDDNSSIAGHDVLDATPARERLGPKRRSIVASAFATVGGGLNRMAAAAAANQQHVESGEGAATAQSAATGRKKSSIGFHLGRFASGGGSGGVLTGTNNPTASGGGLLALAAASQQQQQISGGSNATRNLKTLRQNFFHKLNQLTAKSAAKQDNHRCKSSAPSSYGSSYEPSIDYATTSNMHSANDQYQMETTFGETEDYEQQTSDTTKQSSETATGGSHLSPGNKRLVNIAQQASAAAASSGLAAKQELSLMSSSQQQRVNQNQRPQTISVTNNLGEKQVELTSGGAQNEPKAKQPGEQQSNSITTGDGSGQLLSAVDRQMNAKTSPDTFDNNVDRSTRALGDAHRPIKSAGQVKRRSTDKNDANSMALVCSIQGSSSEQRLTGTNAIVRQGTGFASSSGGGGGGNVTNKAFLASDNERHKRKLAKARERRATLILGLIMATFVSCWFPFFSFYVLRAVCHVCRDYIPPRLEAFIFWMGYCNSACNPIIYTIFNRDFRKAFRKILFRCSRE